METALAVEQTALTLYEQSRQIVVTNAEEYEAAAAFIAGCKQLVAQIEAVHGPAIKAAHDSHKAAIALKAKDLQPVQAAVDHASSVALAWKQEKDRRDREEFLKREAEKAKEREAARLKEAEVLEQWGETEAAEAALKMATIPPRQTKFESSAPTVAGLSTRRKWKARIVNPDGVARQFCLPDVPRINRAVEQFFTYNQRATPEEIAGLAARIGGVEIVEEETFAGRGVR